MPDEGISKKSCSDADKSNNKRWSKWSTVFVVGPNTFSGNPHNVKIIKNILCN